MQKPTKKIISDSLTKRFNEFCTSMKIDRIRPYDAAMIAVNQLAELEKKGYIKISRKRGRVFLNI